MIYYYFLLKIIMIKELFKSSQEDVLIKLRIKSFIVALFPVASSLLRLQGIEVLENDWIGLAEWLAYGIALGMQIWGWVRVPQSDTKK